MTLFVYFTKFIIHIDMESLGRPYFTDNLETKPPAKYDSLTAVIEHLPEMSKQRDVRQQVRIDA